MWIVLEELRRFASVSDKVPGVTVPPQSYHWLAVAITFVVPLFAAKQVAIRFGLLVAVVALRLSCILFGLIAPNHEQVIHLVSDGPAALGVVLVGHFRFF